MKSFLLFGAAAVTVAQSLSVRRWCRTRGRRDTNAARLSMLRRAGPDTAAVCRCLS